MYKRQDYIHLKGHANLEKIYKNYEVYLSASTSEGFGLTLMEAIGSGPVSYTHLDVYKRQPQYSPQLRYFLHRQDLLETDVLSIFDKIQQVPSDLTMRPVQLQDIEWPSETTFSYTCLLYTSLSVQKETFVRQIVSYASN